MRENLVAKYERFIIIAILLVAAFLRLYKVDEYMTFLGDEGRDVLVVRNIIFGFGDLLRGDVASAMKNLTLLGPTSSVGGFFLGPIYYYFMAPFLWIFNFNPVGPAVMVALFGILTVFFVYKIGKEFFDTTTGIIAASLYAVSPLVIAYSRSSWNPNLMPIFTILTLYTLYKGIQTGRIRYAFLSGLSYGIAIQLHYVATFLVPTIVLYVGFHRYLFYKEHAKKIATLGRLIKDITAFAFGFLLSWSPFLGFEVRHGFPNLQSIANFIFYSSDVSSSGNGFAIVGNVFFRLFGRLLTRFPPPEQVALQAYLPIAIWYSLSLLLGIVSVGLFFWYAIKIMKKSDNATKRKKLQQYSLLTIWFFVSIILFSFYKKPIYDYYFEFLFPLPFLLVGFLCSFLLRQRIAFQIAGILLFVILVVVNLLGMPFRFSPNRQLVQVQSIASFVLEKTDGKPFNFALITSGNSDHAYRYFFALAGRDPVVIQNAQKDPKRQSVTDQLLIVCEYPSCHPLGHPLWEVAGFGQAEIVGEWPVSVVKVFKLTQYQKSSKLPLK